MKRRPPFWKILIAACSVLHSAGAGNGQKAVEQTVKTGEGPVFYSDIVSFAADGEDKQSVKVFVKIPYEELQFVKAGDRYSARCESSISIFNPSGERVDGRILDSRIEAFDFQETNSLRQMHFIEAEFSVAPGAYEVLVGVMDFETQLTSRQKTSVQVPAYGSRPLDVSSIMAVDRILVASTGESLYLPNVLGNIGAERDTLYLWFEIYNRSGLDSTEIRYRLYNYKNKVIREHAYTKALDEGKTVEVAVIPKGGLGSGKYKLELDVGPEENGIRRTRDLSVHWIYMPVFASDIDLAVTQLMYIIENKEFKRMRKADPGEKEERFREFWKERDPTPETGRNEAMEEYYRRIAYSNDQFKSYREGWRTDRGMVYIMLGPPDAVERHPFEPHAKPFQIWSYYRFNRDFIFVDETGFGDYRLRSPYFDVLSEIRRLQNR